MSFFINTNYRRFLKVAVFGDSNANGTASTITTCSPGELYNFNGTTYDQITTQSVSNSNPTLGSIWQPLATLFKSTFDRPVYLMNCAKGGTYVSPPGTAGVVPGTATPANAAAANSWGTGGDLRGLAETKIADGLAAISTTATLDLIVVNVGINDNRNEYAIATVETAMDSFVSWINATWPGVPVLVMQVGRSEFTILNPNLYKMRVKWINICNSNTFFHMVGSTLSLFYTSGYEADNLHYNATGQAYLASCIVKWHQNNHLTKWGRSMVSTLYATLTEARKALVDTFMSTIATNGDLFRMEGYFRFRRSHINDIYVDWSFVGYGANAGSTYVANDCESFDGVDDYFATGIRPDWYVRSGVNDVLLSCKVKDNRSLSTTTALYGSGIAGGSLTLVQNGVRLRLNDLTLTALTTPETDFVDDTRYTIKRSGTTKSAFKNKTGVASVTQASTAQSTLSIVVAGQQSTGPVIGSFTNCDLIDFLYSNGSLDLNAFHDAAEALEDSW